MAINQNRYVDIVSGVGAAESVAERQLIGRIFTANVLLPPNTIKEFTSAADVGTYFGTSSVEYLRALFYFSWVSKNITQAPKISFSRWVSSAQAGVIYGKQKAYLLATFTAISDGALNLTIGSHTHTLTGIDLSAAGSLATVTADLQTAIRAYSAGGADWTSATVVYSASPTQGGSPQFVLTGGVTGAEAMGIAAAGSGTDLGPLVGWLDASAIVGQGSAVETLTDTLDSSIDISNNFGSFLFLATLTTDQITEVATWNDSQNVMYQYMVPVTAATASAINAAIAGFAGNAMTLSPLSGEYPEMIPMTVLAATNYDAINSVQNYEFQTGFPVTASVTTDADADTYEALLVNFYGQTQSAGAFITFYQQGVLTGVAQDPVDQNTYANEQWLKDALAAQLLSLLLALAKVSANTQGVAQITAVMQAVINQALSNGTISIGKPLNAIQKLYITNATGSNTAWQQVQANGYWLNVVIVPFVVDSVTKYKAVYTLIYAKDDVIRFIQGSDILI